MADRNAMEWFSSDQDILLDKSKEVRSYGLLDKEIEVDCFS